MPLEIRARIINEGTPLDDIDPHVAETFLYDLVCRFADVAVLHPYRPGKTFPVTYT